MVEAAERVWGWQLRPGYTPGLTFMAHLWQPLRASYRPAFFYLATEALHLLGHGALLAAGFRAGQHGGFTYFTFGMPSAAGAAAAGAPCSSSSSQLQQPSASSRHCCPAPQQPAPLLFLHGVGLGLVPYLDLLLGLAATGRPLLAPQYSHVSLRWSRWAAARADCGLAVAGGRAGAGAAVQWWLVPMKFTWHAHCSRCDHWAS
jgi:hypothetical protein